MPATGVKTTNETTPSGAASERPTSESSTTITSANQSTPDNPVPQAQVLESEDEVVFLEQDSMPGSNKKKRHASNAQPGATEEQPGDGVDPGLKAFLLAMKEDINRSTNEAVNRIDKRIDEHEKNIAELKQAVVDVDRKIEEKIATKVRQELNKASTPARGACAVGPADGRVSGRRQEAYNFCRRTLKMWPIQGDDLLDCVRVFLAQRLNFTTQAIEGLGPIEVSLSRNKAGRDKHEALVTYVSKDKRDLVKAAGVNLGGQNVAGMAIHVPGHLMDNLIALNGIGYNIKSMREGVKRAIKFDDVKQDIYMDILVDGTWKKVTPTKARQVAAQVPGMGGKSDISLDDLTQLVKGRSEDKVSVVVVPEEEAQ